MENLLEQLADVKLVHEHFVGVEAGLVQADFVEADQLE